MLIKYTVIILINILQKDLYLSIKYIDIKIKISKYEITIIYIFHDFSDFSVNKYLGATIYFIVN